MSVSNDGVSRFVASTVYAPTTFAAGIVSAGVTSGSMVCNTIDAEAIQMTLNSDVGVRFQGLLANQDINYNAGGGFNQALALTTINYLQSYTVTAGGRACILPEILDGAGVVVAGVPQGVRMLFITNGGNITFESTAASAAPLAVFLTAGQGAAAVNTYVVRAAGAPSAAFADHSVIEVFSAHNIWVVKGMPGA